MVELFVESLNGEGGGKGGRRGEGGLRDGERENHARTRTLFLLFPIVFSKSRLKWRIISCILDNICVTF